MFFDYFGEKQIDTMRDIHMCKICDTYIGYF